MAEPAAAAVSAHMAIARQLANEAMDLREQLSLAAALLNQDNVEHQVLAVIITGLLDRSYPKIVGDEVAKRAFELQVQDFFRLVLRAIVRRFQQFATPESQWMVALADLFTCHKTFFESHALQAVGEDVDMKEEKNGSKEKDHMDSLPFHQQNIHYFVILGGFDMISERMSEGLEHDFDARIPVSSRRGYSPAEQARNESFYEKLPPPPPPIVAAAVVADTPFSAAGASCFPCLVPYLQHGPMLYNKETARFDRVPLGDIYALLYPMTIAQWKMDPTYAARVASRIQDALLLRLLYVEKEELDQCTGDDYIQRLFEQCLYRIVIAASGKLGTVARMIDWPILDTASDAAWKAWDKMAPLPMLYEMNVNGDEIMECAHVYVLSRYIACPTLSVARRCEGLRHVGRYMELTRVRHRRELPPPGRKLPVTAWLNAAVLGEWLAKLPLCVSHPDHHDMARCVVEFGRILSFVQAHYVIKPRVREARDDEYDDRSACIICCAARSDACLLPCAHVLTCMACAAQLDECTVCRVAITRKLRVFLQ